MRLSKSEREKLHDKYAGRCAYCGCVLGPRWHADHLEAVERVGGKMRRPENDRIDNFMPACAPCNIDKSRMSLENWREWLEVRLVALTKRPGFRLLAAHGLVEKTDEPVLFYFERLAIPPMTTAKPPSSTQVRDE